MCTRATTEERNTLCRRYGFCLSSVPFFPMGLIARSLTPPGLTAAYLLKLCAWEYRVRIVWELGDKNFVVLHHWRRIDQFLWQGSLSIGPCQRLQKRCGFPEGQEQEFGTIRAPPG